MIDYLDGNAPELVFTQLTLDNDLNIKESFWQNNLTRGKWWRKIQQICDSSIQEENLNYTLEGKNISGESVLEDIFDQAMELLVTLIPEDRGLQSRIQKWYSEKPPSQNYGSSITTGTGLRPPWENSWTL